MNGNGRQYIKSNGTRFFGKSRSEKRAANVLGVVQDGYGIKKLNYRSNVLKTIDMYLNGSQYDGLQEWDDSNCTDPDNYTKLSDRKPKIIFPFAKVFQDRLSSKLAGKSTFPKFKIEEDPETDYFINQVLIPGTFFKAKMLSLSKDFALKTSAFCRFKFVNGALDIQKYNTNYCYPEFDGSGNLTYVKIQYVYDTSEKDPSTGKMIKRWFKLELTQQSDILYDNPIYNESSGAEPEFKVVEKVDHEFGFVQGEWFRFGENNHNPDGEDDPIIYQMTEFIDAINYNLSLSDQATNYSTEPQLVISGMDSEEADKLIKSASKTWLLGREGKAEFIELSGAGAENAKNQREDYLKMFQHIARIVLLDPEKMSASAQSGKAMEVMHGPMVELINEMRPWFEKSMIKLIQKIITSIVILGQNAIETDFIVPDGWVPVSLNIKTIWPPIFELTTQDKQQIVSLGIQVAGANIVSRDTILRWIQSQGVDFGVEDFELEQQKVNTQQQFNSFGF